MKHYITILAFFIMASAVFNSCQKAPFLTINGKKNIVFKDIGGTETVTFICNREWTTTSTESWLKISPSKGEANEDANMVSIICDQNTTYDPRTATITIFSEGLSETITVSQDTNYGIIISPTTISLTKADQLFEIEVQANIKYTVSVDIDCKWITQVGTKALSTSRYAFKVSANDTYDNRKGKIYVLGENNNLLKTIEVSQSQTDAIFVSKKEYEISKDGGDIEVKLQTNVKIEITIPDNVKEWLSLKSNSTKALLDESVVFTVAKNKTYYGRTAFIVLKVDNLQDTIKIRQAQTDAMFITNEKEYSFSKAGGNAAVKIFYNVDHIVDGASLPSWINYETNDVDENNKTYNFTITPNYQYVERNAEIVLKSKNAVLKDTVKVSQEQVNIVYTNKNEFNLSKKGDEFKLIVYSNVNYTVEKPDWLKEKSVNIVENNPLETTYTYTVNAVEDARSGSITYKWKDEDVDKTTIVKVNQKNLTITVTLTTAGTLLEAIGGEDNLTQINELIINGPINGTDVRHLRKMSNLYVLNMKNAQIVSGGATYNSTYVTHDNDFGDGFLIGSSCYNLKTLIFPDSIRRIGNDACKGLNLDYIEMPDEITYIGGFAFWPSSLSSISHLILPKECTEVGVEAFCEARIPEITVGAKVRTIGFYTFSGAVKKIHLKPLPTTLTTMYMYALGGNYEGTTIYVPRGTRSAYMLTDVGDYKNVIEED